MIRTIAFLLIPCVFLGLVADLAFANRRSPWSSESIASTSPPPSTEELLQQSWVAYKERFIQDDGRVIDREANDRTVSEGQAYAMLRSVLADDPETFALTLTWAENNLQRQDGETGSDRLWAWKWGKDEQGNWGILDVNFASDADLDAITALILAHRRWHRPEYLELARAKLEDLWNFATLEVNQPGSTAKVRYFIPGPISAFQPQPNQVYLNPSYQAPASFRLFAQVDAIATGSAWSIAAIGC